MIDEKKIEMIKKSYKKGTVIEVKNMHDAQAVPTGTRGVVSYVDDMGTIFVNWDNGSSLGLIYGEDDFEVLTNEYLELEKISNILNGECYDLDLVILNKKNKNIGIATLTNDKMVAIYEGNSDGSDDKIISYNDFLLNYKYALIYENDMHNITSENFDEYVNKQQIIIDEASKIDDMREIKTTAKILLHFKPVANKEIPTIIHHPFISMNPILFDLNDEKVEFIDIFKEKDKYNKYIDIMEKEIDKCESFEDLIELITYPYRLLFFKSNEKYITNNTFNNHLKEIWINTEFPNADKNVSVNDSLSMFKKADKNRIMNIKELMKFENLDDEITIYRGTHKKNNYKALSWTDNYDTARWFAKRFDGDGYVLEATVKKEDVLACFLERNESEIIVDFNKLKDVKVEKVIDIQI